MSPESHASPISPIAIDLYTLPHKGFRHWTAEVATRLGAADLFNRHTLTAVLDDAEQLVLHLLAHGDHEDTFIHPLLACLSADVEHTLSRQHAELTLTLEGLRRQLGTFGAAALDGPTASGLRLALYRALHRFASTNLAHLDYEETVVMPLLWSVTAPSELQAVMVEFRAQVGEEVVAMYRRTSAAYSNQELAALGIPRVIAGQAGGLGGVTV